MVSEVLITNLTTNVKLKLDRQNSSFLLDDDSPDWGSINATDITYPFLSSHVGVGLTQTTLNVPRPISITGYVYNNAEGSIEVKKEILNSFCNPFDTLLIESDGYSIEGHMLQPVVYSSKEELNNDCLCKFVMYITCPFPLFAKENTDSQDTTELTKSFTFPWVIPQNNFVFGTRTRLNAITVNNKGTIATGFVMELKTSASIKGLSFTVGNQVLSLKSNYIFTTGQTIKISTIAGQIGIWLKSDGGEYASAFNILDLKSDWIQLPVGLSTIQISCSEGSITTLDASVVVNYLYYAMEGQ